MPWLLLLACGGPPDAAKARTLHVQALEGISSDPVAGLAICRLVDDPDLLHNCLVVGAKALSEQGLSEEAMATCGEMEGFPAWECYFQLAEQTGEAHLCRNSGELADSCRLHVYSQTFHEWIDATLSVEDIVLQAPVKMAAAELSASDPRPWSATWRWFLSIHTPLDRSICQRIPSDLAQEACLFTGLALFEDQLSQARDRGASLCEGDLPASLAYAQDPELDAVLARRRATDLCDPAAVRESPDAHLPGSGR